MLSFEEFFIKKKIDLFALKSANQELYHEFETHYLAMGEKSFDHSKKFWFNKLRKSYLLVEEIPSPKISSPKQDVATSTDKANDTESKLGIKPKFRAKPTVSSEQAETEQQDSVPAPSGFKPRFKPGITKPVKEIPTEATVKAEAQTEASSETTEEVKQVSSKPAGFKPRFKAGVTKPVQETPTEATIKAETQTEIPSETTEEVKQASSKPAGFKPRFKAGVTKNTPPSDPKEQ